MDRPSLRRVVVIYHNPVLRDIVTGLLARQPGLQVVGVFAVGDLRPEDVARLTPTDLVIDQEIVDEATDPTKVDMVWRALTYDGPKRLVVMGMSDSCIRILSRHDRSNPGEAELIGALSAA
jgi:hypothetical protein